MCENASCWERGKRREKIVVLVRTARLLISVMNASYYVVADRG